MKLKALRIAFDVERDSRNSVERFENIHQIEPGQFFNTRTDLLSRNKILEKFKIIAPYGTQQGNLLERNQSGSTMWLVAQRGTQSITIFSNPI